MESWQTTFIAGINAMTEKNVKELDSLMKHMGVDGQVKLEWIKFLNESIEESFTQMLGEVKVFQNKLIDSIEELLRQLESLCKRLRVKMPSHGAENLSLSEEKNQLKRRISEYESKVKERLDELDNLKKRQADACQSLGCQPISISNSDILPTLEEIDDFANHVEKLENEKFKRETKYLEIKCKILDIINELGIEPSLEIEKNVCSPDDSLFSVTDYNMKWLDEYYDSLKRQKYQTENEIASLREKVSCLWEMLSEDIKLANDFMQKNTGNSLDTLQALQNEVKRCESLKKANIEKFIKKMRSDLVVLWDKCHYAPSERTKFEFFHDNLYTEDLLTFHDIEIEKMKKYYEDNKKTLLKLEKREEYWKRKLELEEKANDPNRFRNRGGHLLKEERERNALTKKITDLEYDLLQMAATFEEANQQPFLSWGRSIPDMIEDAMQEYENNKKQQLSAKKLQRAKSPIPSTSGLLRPALSSSKKNLAVTSGMSACALSGSRRNLRTPLGHTPELSSAAKRKLPPTNLFSSSKRKTPRQGEGKKSEKKDIPKIKLNDHSINQQKKIRYSLERKKRLEKIRRLSKLFEERKSRQTNDSMEYADFEKDMNEKQESCRSTLFSGFLAQPLPATPRPQRTPAKRPALSRTPSCIKLKTVPGSTMDI